MSNVLRAVMKWALVIASACAVGPAASMVLATLRDVDGGRAITMLASQSPAMGVVGGGLVFAAAAVVGAIGAHFFSMGIGFGCSGLVLGWGAWRVTTLDGLIRRAQDGSDLPMLALEGGLVVVLAGSIAMMIWRIGMIRQGLLVSSQGGPSTVQARAAFQAPRSLLDWMVSTDELGANRWSLVGTAIALGSVAAFAGAYLVGASTMKGQAVFAGFAAALGAGLVVQLTCASKHARPTPLLGVLALFVPAVLSPLIAWKLHGGAIVGEVYAGTAFRPAGVVSLDWAVGALLAIPMGMGWAGAMLDVRALPEGVQA